MSHPVGKKEESRARILASAGRGFRSQGYGALGVDGLARGAGVTSGAFYAHFKSKAEAFRAAVTEGLRDLRDGIERMRADHGSDWRTRFISFYMSDRRTCDLAQSCALQSLTGDVARSDDAARHAFTTEFREVVAAAALDGDQEAAIALLAMLAGGVSIARAVDDPELADQIARAVERAAARLGTGDSQ